MNILSKTNKEVIRVLHNNTSEMAATIEKLKGEGWSDNTRISLSGLSVVTESILESQIDELKEKYPNVEIQYPKKGSFLHSNPYVYVTEHEKEMEL